MIFWIYTFINVIQYTQWWGTAIWIRVVLVDKHNPMCSFSWVWIDYTWFCKRNVSSIMFIPHEMFRICKISFFTLEVASFFSPYFLTNCLNEMIIYLIRKPGSFACVIYTFFWWLQSSTIIHSLHWIKLRTSKVSFEILKGLLLLFFVLALYTEGIHILLLFDKKRT